MSNNPSIEPQTQALTNKLQAIQLNYNALKNPEDSFAANRPIQFTSKKPISKRNINIPPTKSEELENTLLQYILDKYDSILTPKQRKLLPNYIEAYLLNLQFQSELNGDPYNEFHNIHQFVREAGSLILGENALKTSRSISYS